jgi:hypothetical protein
MTRLFAQPLPRSLSAALMVGLLPLCMAAEGDGCSTNSKTPAPDVSGEWDITYDNSIDVTIKIGGAVYESSIGVAGGVIEITHNGNPLSFDLDCARPEIICPSEAWPETIRVEQRNVQFEHRMIVTLPEQTCDGQLVPADPAECGSGTLNENCDDVCEGTIGVVDRERFGVIGEGGSSFRLYLGAGLATNGINCALLALSIADADLINSGEPEGEDWYTEEMSAGLVTVGYGGACLWAGDPDMDQELEALVLSASIEFNTGFTGARAP